MGLKEFFGTTKGKVAAGGAGAEVAVGIVVAVLLQGEGYRSIAVDDVRGSVDVVGETNNGQAYKGERLYSGDDVDVKKASELTMVMDNDKYVYYNVSLSDPRDKAAYSMAKKYIIRSFKPGSKKEHNKVNALINLSALGLNTQQSILKNSLSVGASENMMNNSS